MKKFVCDMGCILAALGMLMVAGAAIEGSLALPAAALALAGLGLAIAVLRRAGSRPAPRPGRAPRLRGARPQKGRGLRAA